MSKKDSYLIVGLGNPGNQYSETRHNVGFFFIDSLAEELGLSFKEKSQYSLAQTKYDDFKIFLLKPMMYMNLSGIPTLHVASYYKIPVENIIVVYDDIALNPGLIRVRKKGSAGGHNGIKSIIENLGKDNFIRLRIGIGQEKGIPLDRFVLGRFSKKEKELLVTAIDTAKEACKTVIEESADLAMNRFNGKNESENKN